ncbi:MAG: type VII secretion protein EssC [Defluviitaleaceae bacterium]|nr:type VII secretion protein EssC [Defluviitaleaceae bacterium]
MKQMKIQKNKIYPNVANFDNRTIQLEPFDYHIFIQNDSFDYILLYHRMHKTLALGHELLLKNNQLFVDGKRHDETTEIPNMTIKRRDALEIITTNLPKKKVLIGNIKKAAIQINSKSTALLTPQFDEMNELTHYQLFLRSNGEKTYFNEHQVDALDIDLTVGNRFVIGGVSIEYRPEQLKITPFASSIQLNHQQLIKQAYKAEYPLDFPEYRRSPRILKVPPVEKVTINHPEKIAEASKNALLKTILPPLMMASMGVMTSIFMGGNLIMMIGTVGMSVMTASISVSSYLTNKKDVASKNAKRIEDYDIYLVNKQAALNRLSAAFKEALNYHYPSLEHIAKMMTQFNPRIYEKSAANEDFLEVSLGLGESAPSYDIDFKFDDAKDELLIFAGDLVRRYQRLTNIQHTIKIKQATLGFEGIYPVLKTAVQTLLFQLAFFHSYKDVEFIALVPEEHYETDFKDWRWLPHFKINALNLRGLVHHERSRDMVLNSFYQLITKRKQALSDKGNQGEVRFSPHYVLTILDDRYLQGHGINEYLAEDMSQYGVTVIWCKESRAMLPETVTTLVSYFSSASGELVNEANVYQAKQFTPYQMPEKEVTALAISRLSNLKHVEVEKNAIPKMVTFLDLYHVKKVEALNITKRWEVANTAKTLAVPLGLRGKDDIVELNLHERAHGPHGLVAGTTGSGKSEIVQSYVLSLAVNFSPEDVGFLPIDFKGGGMANEFKNLPHLMGAITNLDGAASARALASIKAELRKRQAMFAKYEVNHINGYTKLYKRGKAETDENEKAKLPEKPIPHLFLISDEFAELKANEPEFMAELVSVARIGRSLGVHLILATQKPSGVVDDQIWSNSRFKLALKVADESDSNEIIKTPDAAKITEPGRAYLQVGNNEIYELFQSAWSGPDYDPDKTVEEKVDDRVWLINDLGQYELLTQDDSDIEDETLKKDDSLPTQLHATVDHIAQVAKATGAVIPDKPWLAPLDTEIISNNARIWNGERDLAIELAMMDIPDEQDQRPFIFDLEEVSHTAIYGSAGFGKSTALQTIVMSLARKNTAEHVHFNLFDLGTNGLLSLKDLPHTADLARLEDEEKLAKFLSVVTAEVARRKALFLDASVASLSQYEAKTGETLPVIVHVFDAWDSLKENPLEEMIGSVVTQLLRDGANVGMYVIITALKASSLRVNISGNIPTKIGLYLTDENDLSELIGREKLPSEEIMGRAQIKLDKVLAMQVYLPAAGEDELERLNALNEEVQDMANSWTGKRPRQIPMLPKEISMDWFLENDEVQAWLETGNIPLGFSMETTEVRGYRPKEDPYFLISDYEGSQTEYLERTILEAFKSFKAQYQRVVFDYAGSYTEMTDAFDFIVPSDQFASFMSELLSIFEERIQNPPGDGLPMLVYVPSISDFSTYSAVTEATLKKIFTEGTSHGIHFMFHGGNMDYASDMTSKTIKAKLQAGLVGTRISEQKLINVSRSMGEAYLLHDEHHYFEGRQIDKIRLVST